MVKDDQQTRYSIPEIVLPGGLRALDIPLGLSHGKRDIRVFEGFICVALFAKDVGYVADSCKVDCRVMEDVVSLLFEVLLCNRCNHVDEKCKQIGPANSLGSGNL